MYANKGYLCTAGKAVANQNNTSGDETDHHPVISGLPPVVGEGDLTIGYFFGEQCVD